MGSTKLPRFKNILHLPCNYRHNKKAWMMEDLFRMAPAYRKKNEGREAKSSSPH
jgi:hypothetical protein